MPAKKKAFKANVEETPQKTSEETPDTQTKVPQVAEEQGLSKQTLTTLEERPIEEEVPLEKTNKKLFVIGLIAFLVIFAATGWILYLTARFQAKVNEVEDQGAEEVSQLTPTPTPAGLAREEISLEILNASGVSGMAATTAKTFEDLGYKVVKTGNSERVSANLLYVGENLRDKLSVLLADVEKELKISSISGEFKDSTASARIILGK